MMKSNNIIVLFLFFCTIGFSQSKNEKEQKIEENHFPAKASLSLKLIKENSEKISLFKETDNKKISYEAKFENKKHDYSIEFSEDGVLEDVEITIIKKAIPKKKLKAIKHFLKENYKKYKFRKIQKQFIFNGGIEQHIFINNILLGEPKPNFNLEIIVEVKENKSYQLKEILFDNSGKHLSTKTVTVSSYGHVLY